MEKEVLETAWYSGVLVKSLFAVLAMIGTGVIHWFRKIFNSVCETKEKIIELRVNQSEFEVKYEKVLMLNKELRTKEQRALEKSIKEEVEKSLSRIWDRVDQNKGSLSTIMDRMTGAMGIYDDKLGALERKLMANLITNEEYHGDIAKIKESFFNELMDIQKQMNFMDTKIEKGGSGESSAELVKSMKKLIDLNKNIIEYESKFSDHEIKLSLYEKKLKAYADKIELNEQSNIDKHSVTKKIITRSIQETKDLNLEMKETIGDFQKKVLTSIESSRQASKIRMESKKEHGKIIKKEK